MSDLIMFDEEKNEKVIVKEFREEKPWEMDAAAKIRLLERRLQVLTASGKDNQGACRRIEMKQYKKVSVLTPLYTPWRC